MAVAPVERAKGVCPECGRTISGRATGIQRAAADRKFVALSPHMRAEPDGNKRGEACLMRGGRRVVPRIRGMPGAPDGRAEDTAGLPGAGAARQPR